MQSTTPPTIYSFHLLHCQIYIKRQILNCKCDASPKQDVTMRAPSESCPSAAQKPNLTSWMMGGDSVPTCCPVWGGMLLGRAEGEWINCMARCLWMRTCPVPYPLPGAYSKQYYFEYQLWEGGVLLLLLGTVWCSLVTAKFTTLK